MASNKKFRIQNGVDIKGEMSFNNVTIVNDQGVVVESAVSPAITSVVSTEFVNALNVSALEAVTAQSVTDISSFSTTDVTEGANEYFTQARARASFTAGDGVSYDALTGEFSADLVGGDGISVSGNTISIDGSAISQDLVPAEDDVYSLGSPDKVWRDVYIGPGSLYLNGTKILEDNSGTITMNADPGQNLAFGVTEGGSIDFNAGVADISFKSDVVMLPGKTISTSGGAATQFGGDVEMNGNCIFNVAVPQADGEAANKGYVDSKISAPHEGNKSFEGNVDIQGNLSVQGTVTTVNSETISLADNIIDLNSNVTSGTPTENAGFRVMRGDEAAAQIRWNEGMDHWEVFNGSQFVKIALSTSDLEEGDNKYFTDERVNAIVGPIEGVLQDADSAEMVARISGDAVLQSAIDAEASARDAADDVLQGNIDSEAGVRESADTALDNKIDSLAVVLRSEFGTGDEGLNDALQQEISDRIAGDSDLNDKIDVEIANRIAGDSDLGVSIAELGSSLTTETQQRTLGDQTLQQNIDAVVSDLSVETVERGAADSDLNDKIDLVDGKVQAILGTSPETLDTLQEIVTAFNTADNSITGIVNDHGSRISTAEGKVGVIEGVIGSGVLGTEAQNLKGSVNELHEELNQAKQSQEDIRDILVGVDSDQLVLINRNWAEIQANASAIDAERQDRLDGDAAVSLLVSNEANARSTGDQNLDTRIDNLEVSMRQEYSNGDSDLNDALQQEIAARIAGDSQLQDNMDSDRSDFMSGDESLWTALNQEIQDRQDGDTDIISIIDSDRLVRIGVDSDLNDKIDSEIQRATVAEGVLQGKIDGIIANTDEVALNSLAELVEAFQGADASLSGVIAGNQGDISTLQSEMGVIQPIVSDHGVTLTDHETRITILENEERYTDSDAKAALVGGLCITYTPETGEIKVDETEALAELKVKASTISDNADALEGHSGDYYRINVYRVDGQLVN
jgi:hypothetical protein